MPDAAVTTDQDEAMLARLAALDLAAAERVHERLMAVEDAGEVAELGRTYQRLARSLRQTLALKARLKRDGGKAGRAEAGRGDPARVETRKAEVRDAVRRVIWTEVEREDAGIFLGDLEDYLEIEACSGRFLHEPAAALVARICACLDLPPPPEALPKSFPNTFPNTFPETPPAAPSGAPGSPPEPPPEGAARHSSA